MNMVSRLYRNKRGKFFFGFSPAVLVFPLFSLFFTSPLFAAIPDGIKFSPVFNTDKENKFDLPLWFGQIPGEDNAFLVLEKGSNTRNGIIWLLDLKDGRYTKSEFLSIPVKAHDLAEKEQGLLGLAFHPNFRKNRQYYINYNPPKSSNGKDSTFIDQRTANESYRKDSGSPPKRIIAIEQPYDNHNGGTIQFGNDGFLYIGMGDGGSGGDPQGQGQNTKTLLGAMLRIDVDKPASGQAYGIPGDNPFHANPDPAVRKEIWAWGLRNPWKWSFDPLTEDLWVGEVGQGSWEEITLLKKGENHGWNKMEGEQCFGAAPNCNKSLYTSPLLDHRRDSAQSITGGYVYRGNPASPAYGVYFYADFKSRYFWGVRQENRKVTEHKTLGRPSFQISSFGLDAAGNIYVLGYHNGVIYKLDHPDLKPPPSRLKPSDRKLLGTGAGLLIRKGTGHAVNTKAFPGLTRIEILSLDGVTIRKIETGTSRTDVGIHLKPGVYIAHLYPIAKSIPLMVD